jgi:hypothetical protein
VEERSAGDATSLGEQATFAGGKPRQTQSAQRRHRVHGDARKLSVLKRDPRVAPLTPQPRQSPLWPPRNML